MKSLTIVYLLASALAVATRAVELCPPATALLLASPSALTEPSTLTNCTIAAATALSTASDGSTPTAFSSLAITSGTTLGALSVNLYPTSPTFSLTITGVKFTPDAVANSTAMVGGTNGLSIFGRFPSGTTISVSGCTFAAYNPANRAVSTLYNAATLGKNSVFSVVGNSFSLLSEASTKGGWSSMTAVECAAIVREGGARVAIENNAVTLEGRVNGARKPDFAAILLVYGEGVGDVFGSGFVVSRNTVTTRGSILDAYFAHYYRSTGGKVATTTTTVVAAAAIAAASDVDADSAAAFLSEAEEEQIYKNKHNFAEQLFKERKNGKGGEKVPKNTQTKPERKIRKLDRNLTKITSFDVTHDAKQRRERMQKFLRQINNNKAVIESATEKKFIPQQIADGHNDENSNYKHEKKDNKMGEQDYILAESDVVDGSSALSSSSSSSLFNSASYSSAVVDYSTLSEADARVTYGKCTFEVIENSATGTFPLSLSFLDKDGSNIFVQRNSVAASSATTNAKFSFEQSGSFYPVVIEFGENTITTAAAATAFITFQAPVPKKSVIRANFNTITIGNVGEYVFTLNGDFSIPTSSFVSISENNVASTDPSNTISTNKKLITTFVSPSQTATDAAGGGQLTLCLNNYLNTALSTDALIATTLLASSSALSIAPASSCRPQSRGRPSAANSAHSRGGAGGADGGVTFRSAAAKAALLGILIATILA